MPSHVVGKQLCPDTMFRGLSTCSKRVRLMRADGEDDSGADTRPHSRATSAEPPALPGADGEEREQEQEQGGEEREDEDGKGVPRLAVKGEGGEEGEGAERAARAAAAKRKSVSFAEPMDVDGHVDGGAGVRVKEEEQEDGGWVRGVGCRVSFTCLAGVVWLGAHAAGKGTQEAAVCQPGAIPVGQCAAGALRQYAVG